MSDRERTYSRNGVNNSHKSYTPFVKRENQAQGVPDVLALGIAFIGMVVQGGPFGIIAGLSLVVLWTQLRVEFVFAAGSLLFIGIDGGSTLLPSVLTISGLVGLLVINLTRAWDSIRLGIGFLTLSALVGSGLVAASREIALHWIGLGSIVIFVMASYAVHRYQVVRYESVDLSNNKQTATSIQENRSNEDQTDMSEESNQGNRNV